MAIRPKVGVLVMALLEDDYNKTAHIRPMAQKVADKIGGIIGKYAETVCPPLVEEEQQAEAAAQQFNAAGVDLIVTVEVAYTKGVVPTRCFLSTTAPVLVWNTQQIESLPENANFDLIMLNSGMAGVPEMTSALLRLGRPFWMVTSLMDDPEGQRQLSGYIAAAGVMRRLKTARIAIFGHTFEGMTDLMIDQLSLRQYVGPVCWPVEPEKVAVAMGEIPDADVKALVKKESGRYKIEMDAAQFERSCRLALALEKDEKGPRIEDLAGLGRTRPWLAAAMAAFMFSLAGVPPLAGFFAKFYAFSGAINSGYTGLVVLAVLMSAVSVYYYLKVTVVMYMKPPAGEQNLQPLGATGLVIFLLALGVLLAGFFSRPLLTLAAEASRWF